MAGLSTIYVVLSARVLPVRQVGVFETIVIQHLSFQFAIGKGESKGSMCNGMKEKRNVVPSVPNQMSILYSNEQEMTFDCNHVINMKVTYKCVSSPCIALS